MFNHLKSLNADASSLETLDKIINMIFESTEKEYSSILLVDYGDKIIVNMKDEGKMEVRTKSAFRRMILKSVKYLALIILNIR
jgi:hypothetical protein